jgi:hypothetical protein
VVVGVTSYGRSFAMADANCYTPDCEFTGTAVQSNAEAGPCTGTPGYLANAEIKDIINDASRVKQNFVDGISNTNILVYDDNQWVGWMSSDIRASRQSIYSLYNMGGSTNWAVDLEDYNDVPTESGADTWAAFILDVKTNVNPWKRGNRTGNWTDVHCGDAVVADLVDYTSSERWGMMNGADAWNDVITIWQTMDEPKVLKQYNGTIPGDSFTKSIQLTLYGDEEADCGSVAKTSNCDQTVQCDGFDRDGSGVAGYEIWNSFVLINEVRISLLRCFYSNDLGLT